MLALHREAGWVLSSTNMACRDRVFGEILLGAAWLA